MRIISRLLPIVVGAAFSSCIYTPPVPDMPYHSAALNHSYPDTWVVQPPDPNGMLPGAGTAAPAQPVPAQNNAPIPPPTGATAASTPAPVMPTLAGKPAAPSNTITTPQNGKLTPTVPKPASPAAAAKPTSMAHRLATDPKSITNQGPIPVATRVEGDPTRVYNPLDPSKTIRVVDRNGKPYPSGKELKVRGTNFHFYVP